MTAASAPHLQRRILKPLMWFVVGLGNPGAQYEWTRHNAGFLLVDRIAREANATIKRRDCRALIGRALIDGTSVELVKPQTYMNLSGESIACLFGKLPPNERATAAQSLIVISDDLALPFGEIRLRARGSSGGHNGLKSIIAALKTDAFVRLRIGIQPTHPVSDTARFVLDEFTRAEREQLDQILEHSAAALRSIINDGIEKAMSQFN